MRHAHSNEKVVLLAARSIRTTHSRVAAQMRGLANASGDMLEREINAHHTLTIRGLTALSEVDAQRIDAATLWG